MVKIYDKTILDCLTRNKSKFKDLMITLSRNPQLRLRYDIKRPKEI
jgi:hypothetical protein